MPFYRPWAFNIVNILIDGKFYQVTSSVIKTNQIELKNCSIIVSNKDRNYVYTINFIHAGNV